MKISPLAVPSVRWNGAVSTGVKPNAVPASAHNNDLFPVQRLVQQARQVRLRFVDIHLDSHD